MDHQVVFMKKEVKIRNLKNSSLRDNEDMPVIDYIDKINKGDTITFLEVGSGECRFVEKLKEKYANIKITCIEINPKLADIAQKLGCTVINSDFLKVQLDQKYDIVHCSHVIEHFSYPAIVNVLETLIAAVAPGGRLIIRSPLIDDKDTWNFYGNIDHIKPYPPEAIQNYFNMTQQQKQGHAEIEIEHLWYRTSPKQLETLSTWHLLYGLKIFRKIFNFGIRFTNRVFQFLWNRYRWPSTRPHGYVLFMKIIHT